MTYSREIIEKETGNMRYTWIDEYLLDKKGVTKDIQKDWNWIRYQIGGKMFAAICLDEKNEPDGEVISIIRPEVIFWQQL